MKITIEHYDEVATLEVSDNECNIETFADHLERILMVMWLPEQVEKILGHHYYDEGYDNGYKEGYKEGMHTVSPSTIRNSKEVIDYPRDALGNIKSNPS